MLVVIGDVFAQRLAAYSRKLSTHTVSGGVGPLDTFMYLFDHKSNKKKKSFQKAETSSKQIAAVDFKDRS